MHDARRRGEVDQDAILGEAVPGSDIFRHIVIIGGVDIARLIEERRRDAARQQPQREQEQHIAAVRRCCKDFFRRILCCVFCRQRHRTRRAMRRQPLFAHGVVPRS